MTLQERVTVLEHDVVVLRSETRGWAEVAVSAKSQADSAREMMTLIYREVIEIKSVLKSDVGQLKRDVAGLTSVVAGHTETLDQHTETLDQHTVLLHEILDRLPPRPAA
jgi:hypothetical protein